MKMNKMFAGLIAFVAGVALSAGSAFATNGYVGGDFARTKLVPYFETGDSKATIIGIQNLSPRETSTSDLHQDVADLQAYLSGAALTADQVTNLNAGNIDIEEDVEEGEAGRLAMTALTEVAEVEAALEKAMAAVYTEHLFISVNVHDTDGMMMGSATLCLAEHEFGHVTLQGATDEMGMYNVLSVMDGDIPESGFVLIRAESRKFTGCGATAPNTLMRVVTPNDTSDEPPMPMATSSEIAAWTIIQDVGDGFFGTEVPTSTITMMADMDDPDMDGDESMTTNCYNPTGATAPLVANEFNMSMCGLIPERHNNARGEDGALTGGTATVPANAIARYDAGDESLIVLWLAAGGDTDDTLPRDRRKVEVLVKCEDGMIPSGPDTDGDNMPNAVTVAAPGMVTMIDPTMGDVGDLTDMCAGDRGVLRITMPDGSAAGAVFSHITQMDGHYRMNFPGYSKAMPTALPTP